MLSSDAESHSCVFAYKGRVGEGSDWTSYFNGQCFLLQMFYTVCLMMVLMITTISLEGKNMSPPKIGDFFLFLKYEREHKLKIHIKRH